jgi:acyl carrier protein
VSTAGVVVQEASATELPNIGKPIDNTRVLILDRNRQPVGVGVPGEVYLTGAGIARGYVAQPDLTSERFLELSLSGTKERYYRTGDLARWRWDGSLEFLGRVDQQIKLRGYRIELGEIEAVLSSHPAVQEAVVILRDDLPGGKGLVGYVVQRPDVFATGSELREHLASRLPDYMLPTAIVLLEKLPLTNNGKIDRKNLPKPQMEEKSVDQRARTRTEEVMAGIWCEVLQVPSVGLDQNFFELGGHSLLATQMLTRIKAAFATDLPLRSIFECPTVSDLSREVEKAGGIIHEPSALPTGDEAELLAKLQELSPEELERLLESEAESGTSSGKSM